MRLHVLTFALICVCFLSFPAQAEKAKILDGGQAVKGAEGINTDSGVDFYNYHLRRIEFQKEQKKFRKALEKRRESFAAPRKKALKEYDDALRSHYARSYNQ